MIKIGSDKLKIAFMCIAIYLLIAVVVITFTYDENLSMMSLSASEINYVTLIHEDNSKERVKIPLKLENKEKFEFILDISEYMKIENASVTTNARFSNLEVYADDKLLYEKKTTTEDIMGSGGNYLVFFNIPDDLKSPYLRFVYRPLLRSENHTHISTIMIGNKTELILTKLLSKLDVLFISVLMFINIVNAIMIGFLNRKFFKKENYGVFYLSILALIISTYFMTQAWFVKFIFMPYNTALYFVEYTTTAMMPIPFLSFFKYELDAQFKKLYNGMIYITFANLIIQSVLSFLNIYEYQEMLPYSYILIFLSLGLVAITFILTDSEKYPIKKKFAIPLLIIVPLGIFPVISDILTNSFILDSVAVIICASFIALEMIELYTRFSEHHKEKMEKEIYKKMANTDSLTRLKNRVAYEAFLVEFSKCKKSCRGWFVSMDLNGLKTINDTYGHLKGDQLIVNFSSILLKEEEKDENIKAFRIGGDEFFVFVFENDTFDINAWIDDIKVRFAQTESFVDGFIPSFAAGSYYVQKSNQEDFEKAFHAADERMYEDKKGYKNLE